MEVFDIKFYTNRPGITSIKKDLYENEAFQKVMKDLPEDKSLEEQKKFMEDHGFTAEIKKFRHLSSDDFTPEQIKYIGMHLDTREEIRRSAFVFEVKRDKKLKNCIKKMPNGLTKKQIAEYLRDYGYIVTDKIGDNCTREYIVTNPIKQKR